MAEEKRENTAKTNPVPAQAGETEGAKRRRWWHFPRSWKEVKALGWKAILAFILFYLIRDSILYILLPYLAYKGIIG